MELYALSHCQELAQRWPEYDFSQVLIPCLSAKQGRGGEEDAESMRPFEFLRPFPQRQKSRRNAA